MKVPSIQKQILVWVFPFTLFLHEAIAQPSSAPRFFENKGQILDQDLKPNPAVKYLMPGPGKNVQLLNTGFSIDEYVIRNNTFNKAGILSSAEYHFQRSDIEFTGINPNCEIIPEDPSADYLNYYTTGSGEGGITHVRGYGSIRYKDLYHGIDLIFLADNYNAFSFHFVFKPGSEKEIIKVRINNIEKTAETLYGMNYYRDIPRESRAEASSFDDLSSDPERIWGTYYGGSNTEFCFSTMLDLYGNVFLGGSTYSVNNIATSGSHQSTLAGSQDVYLAKFNSDGTRLWGTYYGGTSFDHGGILLTDFTGNIYIHGETESTSGIATAGAHQPVFGGGVDCFLAKFTTDGLRLWGTYYGGSSDEEFGSIALSPDGRIAMAGRSNSTNNISSTGAHQVVPGGANDSFLAVFTSDGVRQWGTYYGGSADEDAQSCTFDLNGNVFLSGMTESTSNISTSGSHQAVYGGGQDAFLAKFNSPGNRQWGTYYGGGNYEKAWCCIADPEGNIFLGGSSTSQNNISTPGAYQEENHGSFDGFLVKFTTGGSRVWGTYQGGSNVDEGQGLTIDMAGNIFLTGTAFSADFPVTGNAFQTVYGGNIDAFLSRFDPSGQLIWSTYYGGGGMDIGWSCKIDTAWHIYLCGQTESANNISTPGSHQPLIGGLNDGFLVKFQDCQAPFIINNPADTLLCEGDVALFQVGALGTSLAYQWQEDAGSGYNDLTNTGIYEGVNSAQLHINGIMAGMNGYSYQCVVGGNCSPEAISESAVLEVVPQPVPSISGPSAACSASSGNQYATETGMTNYSWEVSSGGQIDSGEGTSSITVTWNADGVQTVYVGYTGLSGCNTVVPAGYDVSVYPSPPSPLITASGNMLISNSPDGNQWYFEGAPVANATAPTYFATQTGWYWDVVTLNACSSDTSNNLYVLVSGLSCQDVTFFSVYPSPGDGILYITFFCQENQSADISVFNFLGTKIIDYPGLKGPLTFKADISNEPAGVYFVVFRNKDACMVKKILLK